MTGARSTATLLLPARTRLHGQGLPVAVARAVGRADALPPAEPGARAQLQRHFDLLPRGWPVAALTRSVDANDADSAQWLRADPAWVRPTFRFMAPPSLRSHGIGFRCAASLVKPDR